MSHIAPLRQRIKTVSTIQKLTHAMRLTSMSTHSRLHKKLEFLKRYSAELEQVSDITHTDCIEETTDQKRKQKTLLIVVGSQKGLCGAFNNKMFRYFEEQVGQIPHANLITIGKRINELIAPKHRSFHSLDMFNPTNFFAVTSQLYEHIIGPENYTDVCVLSNDPVSFFLQKPIKTTFATPTEDHQERIERQFEGSHVLFDQNPHSIKLALEELLLRIKLEETLFKSLIAEQAARFLSMDASTTNAEKMLEEMKRDYNKLRQANITRELTDLTSSLL